MVSLPMIIILVTSCLLSHGTLSYITYFSHFCLNNVTFAANSTYQANLEKLLTTLSSNAATNNTNGSFNLTVSSNSTTVYGLYTCRGDITTQKCSECVSFAVKDIVKRCPLMKEVIIWYSECLLRYSDDNIIGIDQEDPMVTFFCSAINISNPERLTQFLGTTMSDEMALQAATDTSGKKFATREVTISSFETVYSMVQCTGDLPPNDCVKCIKTAVSSFCSYGQRRAAIALLPSCVARYDSFPFYYYNGLVPTSSQPEVPPPSEPTYKGKTSTKMILGITVPAAILTLVLIGGVCMVLTKRAKPKPYGVITTNDETASIDFAVSADSLQYDLSVLQSATNNFSDANKLGQGGFGGVYRGKLSNGQEIAVKRLSQTSGQGVPEFKNEVVLVHKLQHRNLVRLLGFCLAGNEKLLVYEYVPNKSLDYFLFDPEKQAKLDWSTRYKIIGGIARGMLYLHEDSRLRIIHRDLKPSNILLDADMNPKISDFGMARIFGIEQSQGNTNRVVGTYGYMAPEYAYRGEFSVKSDVYSFGILVLEIISGKKINDFHLSGYADNLVNFAWKNWKENQGEELKDPSLREGTYSMSEVQRCVHLGLLCVQEDMEARPTMSTVVLSLSSVSVSLPVPKNPAFYSRTQASNSGMSDQSASNSNSLSTSDISITQLAPRP